jgi:hypothetical protein
MRTQPAEILSLTGSPAVRGRAQAALAGTDAAAVREVVETRLVAAAAVIETPEAAAFLARQTDFARRHCEPEMAEIDGIAEGFGLAPDRLFALLNLSVLSGRYDVDGCTAWARPLAGGGAVLVKNRDLTGPHRSFQALFRHDDPASPVGPVLAVGTLGAPGVYSSGINAAGLALADTAISAARHGVGWLRYLLMTRLLFTCSSVADALETVRSVRHSGGGSLILADAGGAVAAIEFLPEGPRVDTSAPAFRTNHFLAEPLEATAARIAPAAFVSTTGRRRRLAADIDAGLGLTGLDAVAAAMASHGEDGLCRHGEGDGSHTVSCALYTTADRGLRFARGNPCEAAWERAVVGRAGPEVSP